MERRAQAVQAAVQMLSELTLREWRSPEDWRQASEVPRLLADEVGAAVESFAGGPVLQGIPETYEVVRGLATQVRDELFGLLGQLEPEQATAVLCGLPGAERQGYARVRLAARLGVEEARVSAWEEQAYERVLAMLSERTPLLAQVASLSDSADVSHAPAKEDLLVQARRNADFDLRRFVSSSLELEIRRAFHREGLDRAEQVRAHFSLEPLIVNLVGERMKLEFYGEEEEEDAGTA